MVEYDQSKAFNVKIAYIGGGSRGWAWGLMSDLAQTEFMSGDVYLYDIDNMAAQKNEVIGNKFNHLPEAKSRWNYKAVNTIEESLNNADFVVISIMPGTFDEMDSDVHWPERYDIYQSVGDTTGPGGILRAMRTIPMYEYIAERIKECCPDAWVINYTNPMTLCVKALYRVFPQIKAFGCCHEVFGTQKFLMRMVKEVFGKEDVKMDDIKVNPIAVNHFTWFTEATYRNIDLFPYYKSFCEKYAKDGYAMDRPIDSNWMNSNFASDDKVKMDLFLRFGWIAAAGDRHLAEFCPGNWYLESPKRVSDMHFHLTPVEWRKKNLQERLDKCERLYSGEESVKIEETGEKGVKMMESLLGLGELVTNVNLPNYGQIPNLPLGAVVESNAVFRSNSLKPVFAGEIPKEIFPLVSTICNEQEVLSEGIAQRDIKKIFNAFANDPLVTISQADAKKMFKEMCENTKKYLSMYDWNNF